MKKNINNLGYPKNNTEMYLKYLTGTSTVAFQDLPLPYTNIDTYLHYLCENGGIGGGAGGGGGVTNTTANSVTISPIVGINGDNVQSALQEIMDYLPLIQSSDIYIFQDYAEYLAQKPTLNLKKGDLLNFIDSTNVIDFQGTGVDNNGRPVTMIFDNTLTGNQLRLFAKLSDTINLTDYARLSANNVFTGYKNIFNNISVGGVGVSIQQQASGDVGVANSVIKWGRRDCISHAGGKNGHVKCLQMGVPNTKAIGSMVTVSVWEVNRVSETDRSQDIPTKIASSVQLPVKDGAGWYQPNYHYIEYPINKKYDTPHYFIYCIENGSDAIRSHQANTRNNFYVYITGQDVTSATINGTTVFDTMGLHRIIVGDVDVVDYVKNEIKDSTSDFIKTWSDLEYVSEYPYVNLLDIRVGRIEGKYYGTNGSLVNSSDWNIIHMPVEEGETYTVFRNTNGSSRITYLELDGTFVSSNETANTSSIHGYHRKVFTVPTGSDIAFMGINFSPNELGRVMVIKGNHEQENISYIPYINGGRVLVGRDVKYEYDNSGLPLTSTDMNSAINESFNVITSSLTSYTHNDRENIINSKTTIVDGYLPSVSPISTVNPNYTTYHKMGENAYCCSTHLRANPNQYVERLVVGIHESVQIGSTINNITISVSNLDGVSNQTSTVTVQEHICENSSAVVYANPIISGSRRKYPIDCDRVVIIPVKNSWIFHPMFILSVPGMIWAGRRGTSFSTELGGGGDSRLKVGQRFTIHQGNNSYIGRAVLYGSDVRLSNVIMDITFDHANGILTFRRADGSGNAINLRTGATNPIPIP